MKLLTLKFRRPKGKNIANVVKNPRENINGPESWNGTQFIMLSSSFSIPIKLQLGDHLMNSMVGEICSAYVAPIKNVAKKLSIDWAVSIIAAQACTKQLIKNKHSTVPNHFIPTMFLNPLEYSMFLEKCLFPGILQ